MSQMFPDIGDNVEAMKGDASHEIAETLVDNASRGLGEIPDSQFLDKSASNGVIMTQEMIDCAREYSQEVIKIIRKTGIFGGANLGVERRIQIPTVHDQCFGTPDCYLFDSKTGTLYIWDYKFGMLLVEAFENWQMIVYLAGIIYDLQLNGHDTQFINVKITVVQPRGHHKDGTVRTWETTAANLRGYFNILHDSAHKALSQDASTLSGKHCRFCNARHACATGLAAGTGMYEASMMPTPLDMPPQAMGLQLSLIERAMNQLKYIHTGLKQQVEHKIRHGESVPGWTTEPSYGHLDWDKPREEIKTLGELFNTKLEKEELVTPTQAIKLGIDEEVIKAYSSKPKRGVKVVAEDLTNVRRVFEK